LSGEYAAQLTHMLNLARFALALTEVGMNERRPQGLTTLVRSAYALLVALMLAACGGAPAAAPTDAPAPAANEVAPTSAPVEDAAPAGDKPTIKLAENSWTGSSINVYVAKILIEKELGYPVEIVTIDENAQWAALSSGDLSASLEVWPSGHADNRKTYIEDQKVINDIGELGVVGKIGWFLPKYVVDQHPELATWEGFKDPALAGLFKTAETGDKGQFLAGDPAWVQYDEDIINTLGLELQIVRAGSEQAVLAAVDSAYSRQEPILFYFWTPHSVLAKYELTTVELPAYTDECGAKAGSGTVDCEYPPDNLYKIAWSGLEEQAPEVYSLLSKFNYTNEDQISMIAAVDTDKKSPEEAAQAWIDSHEDVWKAWLP
jgi:glycine betaine/proline transport system substrate-binding protein